MGIKKEYIKHNYGNLLEKFKKYLIKNKFSFTYERRIILDTVVEFTRHFDAEEITALLKQGQNAISRSTIYRTLGMLEKASIIRRMVGEDKKYIYELIDEIPHYGHIYCQDSGKVINLEEAQIYNMALYLCKKYDINMEDCNLIIKGNEG